MAKKKRRLTTFHKIIIVGLALSTAQLLYIFVFKVDNSITIREAINKSVAKLSTLSPEERELMKINMALTDYLVSNNNQPPKSLDELVGKYFDRVPLNPNTGRQFDYKIINGRGVVGDPSALSNANNTSGKKMVIATKSQEDLLLSALDDNPDEQRFVYDSNAKRDPFLPFNFAPLTKDDPNKTALEKYDIGQLKLTAILEGFDQPKAIVENTAGRGFTVTKGTKIGPSGGEVVDIQKDRLLILETTIDFTGEKKTRTIEMKLRLKEKAEN